eukprot:scaffold12837_cov121-Isochrysis_galbana.AAC.2
MLLKPVALESEERNRQERDAGRYGNLRVECPLAFQGEKADHEEGDESWRERELVEEEASGDRGCGGARQQAVEGGEP